MKIFAGFDCGGSNTRCMLVSEEGLVLGYGKGGPSNYLFCGKETAAKSISDSIRLAFENAGMQPQPIERMFIASAAVEVFSGHGQEAFFQEVTGCSNVECDSDILPVWYAGSRLKPAVAMISGTGSVTYLLKDQSFVKSGGWGPQFGDEGSGFGVGIHAIRYAAKMSDGRMEIDEEFYRSILEHFEVDPGTPRRLLRAINQEDYRSRAATAASVVNRLCEKGNKTAKEIIEAEAEELVLSVKAVLKKAEGKFVLLLAGGLLQNKTPLQQSFLQKVRGLDQIERVEIPQIEAVRSAAAIALSRGNCLDAAERLMQEE